MKCSKCNHEYNDSLGFCPMCGYVETAAPESGENPSRQMVHEPVGNEAPKQQPAQVPPPVQQQAPQQQMPQQQYSSQQVADAELASARSNATAALVCGVLGFVIPFVGVVLAIIAVVLGGAAKKKLPDAEKAVASAGFILGMISLIFAILSIVVIVGLIGMAFTAASYLSPYGSWWY